MTPADVLDKAAAVIELRGHTKHTLQDSNGRLCALGGIYCAASDSTSVWNLKVRITDGVIEDAITALAKAIDERPFSGRQEIVPWNNAPERTAEEVTSTMRAAAATWRAQHEAKHDQREEVTA